MYLCQSACGVVGSRAVLFMSFAQIPSRVVSICRVILTSAAESSLFAIKLLLDTLVRSLMRNGILCEKCV